MWRSIPRRQGWGGSRTYEVDNRRATPPGIVEVGKPVGQARAQVQQRERRLARHAAIAIYVMDRGGKSAGAN